MAYKVSNAVAYARTFIRNIPTTGPEVIAADEIDAIIWRAAPWRWTVSALTAIPLVDQQQDYAVVPTNFYRLVGARVVRTDTSPEEIGDPLTPLRNLEPSTARCSPRDIVLISHEPSVAAFRLEAPPSITSPVTYELRGEYQFKRTRLTDIADTLPIPEDYFNVFVAGFIWKMYKFVDDARAGAVVTNGNGGANYTGAMGEFMEALHEMMGAEGWAYGEKRSPRESLMAE